MGGKYSNASSRKFKEQKIRIEAGSGLTKEEIEKMKAEAKANEASDKIEKERVEKLNEADSLIFQTEKQLKEFGDKIPADKKAPIETALETLKVAHQAQDVTQVEAALAAMNTAWTAASEEIYKAQAEGAGAGAAPGADAGQANGGTSNDTVEDAQFEEVK